MIWLKNFIAYRLADDHGFTAKAINDSLLSRPFIAPGSQDLFSSGWVSPHPHPVDFEVTHIFDGCALAMLRTDERILPASVVRREADIRIKHIEEEEGRKVGRREAREILETMTFDLMPGALIKSSFQRVLIDMRKNIVFAESGSASKADNLLSILRETIGSLPTRLIQTQVTPQTAMTNWLESGAPAHFSLDADCELKFPGDGGAVARFTRQNLDTDEIRQHLATGKLATRLGLEWQDRIAFQLTDKLEFKRVNMLDTLEETIQEADAHDQAALFDASFALTVGELRGLIDSVIEALGGELK